MSKRFWLSALLMCAVMMAIPAAAQEATVTGGDDNSLRAFIARMFAPAPGVSATTQVIIGALPVDYTSIVPLPPGATVLGSVITQTGSTIVQVYYDIASAPANVVQYYQAVLAATWHQTNSYGTVGFVDGTAIPASVQFCTNSAPVASLNLTVQQSPSDPNTARASLTYQANSTDPQCSTPSGSVPVTLASQLIPALTPPDGATVLGGTSGGGALDQYYTLISLQTTLSSAAVAANYNAQLVSVWMPTSTTGDDTSAEVTSAWEFTDPEGGQWTGILVVTANGADIRFASLQVIKAR